MDAKVVFEDDVKWMALMGIVATVAITTSNAQQHSKSIETILHASRNPITAQTAVSPVSINRPTGAHGLATASIWKTREKRAKLPRAIFD